MDRITDRDIREMINTINKYLKNIYFEHGKRYGYNAIDIYDKKEGYMIKTLVTGLSKPEMYMYLQAVYVGLNLVDYDKSIK